MLDQLTLYSLIFSLLSALIGALLNLLSYRNFSGRTGWTMITGSFLIVVWISLDFYLLNYVTSLNQALSISSLSSSILASGLYLTHYFYDEISATYRQRKTMTLGSIVFGSIVGLSWIEGFIEIDLGFGVQVHPILVLLIILQGGLLTHRIVSHLLNQGQLSYHYGINSIFSKSNRWKIIFPLILILLSAIGVFVLTGFTPYSTPFYVLVTTAYLFLALISSRDPLSSMPVAQPLEAIALVSEREDQDNYHYIFGTGEVSVVNQDNFGLFIREISNLLTEITKSETRIVSFNTKDLVVMFEPIGERTLVLILKKRNPSIRKMLQRAASSFTARPPVSNTEFTARSKHLLMIPEGGGKYYTSDFLIVYNYRSSTYRRAKKRWEHFMETQETLLVDEFTEEYLKNHSPNAVVVMGGDGTVHSVASTVYRANKDIKIGILPGGGGNDIYERWFEREIEFFDADGIASHPVFKIEYTDGRVEYAANTIEWGIGAIVAAKRENNEGKLFLGMSKYFYLLLKSLRLYNSWASTVIIDGEKFSYHDLSAVVVGFGASSMGGGYMMFPDEAESVNKRQPFVLIARGFEKMAGLSLIIKLARMKQYDDERVIYRPFKTLELLPGDEERTLPITVDGELRSGPPVKITLEEEHLKTMRHI